MEQYIDGTIKPMTDGPQHDARWDAPVNGTLVTIGFAFLVVGAAQRYGRTIAFAVGVNWVLIVWAIWLGRILETRSGERDGLTVRLPAAYYAMHRFEKGGRVYDYLGVRWYQRLLRPILWSVNPALLRSRRVARQALIRATQDPEVGHLVIFALIFGITVWAVACAWWNTAAWLLLFNVLHNGYPVLSLRQIRARLNRHGGTT